MIRVLIADQSGLTCDAMRSILDDQEDIYVVGSVTTEEELCFLLPQSDLVLLGVPLGNRDVSDIIKKARRVNAKAKVLLFGVSDDPCLILQYIEAGASGYVLQQESIEALMTKMRAAYNDRALISPDIAAQLMKRLTDLANHPLSIGAARKVEGMSELTSREREILGFVSRGYSNQEIADELVIGYGTVKNHLHNILKKLEISNRRDAAAVYDLYREQRSTLGRVGHKSGHVRLGSTAYRQVGVAAKRGQTAVALSTY